VQIILSPAVGFDELPVKCVNTGASYATACSILVFHWPFTLAVGSDASRNAARTASAELQCTSVRLEIIG
jgi:hypothetical protein